MPRKRNVSAGLLLYRRRSGKLEVFLAHPGGPFWLHRDDGAWTIPKGLVEEGEEPIEAAMREFEEETGFKATRPLLPLGTIKQKAGKTVHAWAFEGDVDPSQARSITMRYRTSQGWRTAPEVDRYDWFNEEEAARKLNAAQAELVLRLASLLEAEQ